MHQLSRRTRKDLSAPVFDPALENTVTNGHSCGLNSLEDVNKWFPRGRVRRELKRDGFRLYAYEVPDELVLRGYDQCAFRKDDAKRLGRAAWSNGVVRKKQSQGDLKTPDTKYNERARLSYFMQELMGSLGGFNPFTGGCDDCDLDI